MKFKRAGLEAMRAGVSPGVCYILGRSVIGFPDRDDGELRGLTRRGQRIADLNQADDVTGL